MSIRQYVAVKKSFKSLLHSAKCNTHFSKCTVPETVFSSLTSALTTDHPSPDVQDGSFGSLDQLGELCDIGFVAHAGSPSDRGLRTRVKFHGLQQHVFRDVDHDRTGTSGFCDLECLRTRATASLRLPVA